MPRIYSHTQTGMLLRLAMLPGMLGVLAAGWLTGKLLILAPLALILGALGWFFGSLTIEVTSDRLSWHFGPGIWPKSVARADIIRATSETNPWWYGWGIHLTPHGWLYNVAGFKAVEITLRDGRRFRLGTDEPDRLAAALRALP